MMIFPIWEYPGIIIMRVVAEKTLRFFWMQHADAHGPLEAWLEFVKRVEWNTPADLQRDYGNDAVLPNNRAVFNIKGNKYRLVAHIHYKSQIIFIRFLGTHAEYNRINATKI
jgi:mRNA interferase HigB